MGMNYQLDATVCDLCRMDNLDDDCAHCELVPFSPKRESDTYYEDT